MNPEHEVKREGKRDVSLCLEEEEENRVVSCILIDKNGSEQIRILAIYVRAHLCCLRRLSNIVKIAPTSASWSLRF